MSRPAGSIQDELDTNDDLDVARDAADASSAAAKLEAIPTRCHICGGALAEQYFELNNRRTCDACLTLKRARREGQGAPLRTLRALTYGSCAAGLGVLIFYGLRWATGFEFGVLTLLIGFTVGTAVRIGSGGRGGPAYQALAAALIVAAIASTHLPAVAALGLDRSTLSLAARTLTWALVAPFHVGYAALFGTLFALLATWISIRLARATPFEIEGPFELTIRP